jgi:hypothetical protein
MVSRNRKDLNRRLGYTLLEVILASSIAVLLLGALYVAVDMQMRQAQAGRDVVLRAALSRTLFDRIANDIGSSITLDDPARWRLGNQSSGGGMSGGGMSGGGMTGAAGAGSNNAAASGAASTTASTSNTGTSIYDGSTTTLAVNANTVGFPLGIQGNSTQLNIFLSRVPREALVNPNAANPTPNGTTSNGGTISTGPQNSGTTDSTNTLPVNQTVSSAIPIAVVGDVRRVTYWLVGGDGTGSGEGLARMEAKLPTSDDITNLLPPNIGNEAAYILAPEVRNVQFQYWDGTNWNDTWDSTTLGADGKTPIGSPQGIAVTLDIAQGDGPDAPVKTFRQFIRIGTSNGTTVQTATGTQAAGTINSTGGGSQP